MSARPARPEPANPVAARDGAHRDERAGATRALLRDLIDRGTALACAAAARARAQPDAIPACVAEFDRLARAVRRAVALAHRLSQPPRPERAAPVQPVSNRRAPSGKRTSRVDRPLSERRAETIDRDRLDATTMGNLDPLTVETIIAAVRRDLDLDRAAAPPATEPRQRLAPRRQSREDAPARPAPAPPGTPAPIARPEPSIAPPSPDPATASRPRSSPSIGPADRRAAHGSLPTSPRAGDSVAGSVRTGREPAPTGEGRNDGAQHPVSARRRLGRWPGREHGHDEARPLGTARDEARPRPGDHARMVPTENGLPPADGQGAGPCEPPSRPLGGGGPPQHRTTRQRAPPRSVPA